MLRRILVLILAILLSAALWGCGSNRDSKSISGGGDGLGSDPDTGIAYVGADVCIGCHEGFSWSAEAVAKFLESKHVLHSTHIDADSGDCLQCHDPVGDGPTIEDLIDPAYVPANGLAAVTCEACHGAGGQHNGIGPVPDPVPNFEVCGSCHNELPESHIPHHPFADNILDNFKKGAHYMVDPDTGENEARDGEPCFRCHSDQGYRDYIGITEGLDADELDIRLAGIADLPVATTVQCRTCHDPHSGELRAGETTARVSVNGSTLDPRPVSFSRQFNLCTNCHQAFLTATPVVTGDSPDQEFEYFTYVLDNTRRVFHDTSSSRIIVDTHFADPDNGIVGYNIDASKDNACSQCHDVHGATKFEQAFASGIAVEWGETEGFHGDYTSEAFTHTFSSAVCMECHNGDEFVKVTEGLEPADLTLEDARVVACGACHDLQAMDINDADMDGDMDEFHLGAVREIEEFAFPYWESVYEEYADDFPELELATVEGLEENALCMTCHSGRSSKFDVDNAVPQDDGTYRFVNIHYRAAGASLFGNMAKGGYEYDGKVYASKFEHVESNDLCVECHNVHSGELFFSDPGFGPTGCDNCHVGVDSVAAVRNIREIASVADYDGDGNVTEGIYYEVDTLKTELEAVLVASGVMLLDGYPYFGNITTEAQLRAAYNLQVATIDTGSWAHNPSYTMQLLIDSLEDMGQTTNSVTGFDYVRDDMGHFASQTEPFRHWDLTFDETTGEYDDGSISSSCNKCHSSEGGAYFLENGTAKTTYDNTYTMGISSGLACETCHTAPFDGEVRFVESVEFPSGITITDKAFSDDDSTVCMTCHQGRNSKVQVDEQLAAWDGVSELRFTNIHYFAAAASLFGTDVLGGYEYDVNSNVGAQTYAAQNTFPPHPDTLKTCTGCHLQEGANDHSFIPDITRCNNCHAGATFPTLAGSPSVNYDAINTLKAELRVVLEDSGVTFLSGYPYFDNLFTAAQLKAAYNWQTADKEPCGYIHNGDYIQQLLYDSIVDMGGTPSIDAPDRDGGGVTPPPTDPGQVVYDADCASCHVLGMYDTTGFAPDLSGKSAEVDVKYPVPDVAGHQGITLSATEITDVKVFVDAN